YMGPAVLDRTHQISFGGIFGLPMGFQTGIIAHFYSPLSSPLVVPNSGLGNGEIYRTDFTGDGTAQDYVPGTKNGTFMRDTSVSGLDRLISNYNSTTAGQPTPAGQVLIQNGLFTLDQLQAMGAVAPALPVPAAGQVGMGWLKDVDFSLNWKWTFKD